MKVGEDRKDIINNVIAGAILVHYGALVASIIFFSGNNYLSIAANVLLIFSWAIYAARRTKQLKL